MEKVKTEKQAEKRFVVAREKLFNCLAAMQPICTKRTTLDATTTILFCVSHNELILKSTDLEISLQASCQLEESTFTSTEQFLVPGKRVFEVVKELDGLINFNVTQGQLIMSSGRVTMALNIKSSEEFPPFPERIENLMHLDAPFFQKMLEHVIFLVPQSNVNPALNGLFVEINSQELTMTATDGHCLAQARSGRYTLAKEHSWLLPKRTIVELKKILDSFQDQTIFVGTCGNQLVFSGDVFNFFTRLLVDSFPNYKPIMDKTSFIPASVDRAQFTKTLRRSACLLSGQFLPTKFLFDDTKVRVSLNNKDVGTLDEELPIGEFTGVATDIRFYAPYILNGIQAFADDNIMFYLNGNSRPIIFESDNQELKVTYLVMPVAPTQHT